MWKRYAQNSDLWPKKQWLLSHCEPYKTANNLVLFETEDILGHWFIVCVILLKYVSDIFVLYATATRTVSLGSLYLGVKFASFFSDLCATKMFVNLIWSRNFIFVQSG